MRLWRLMQLRLMQMLLLWRLRVFSLRDRSGALVADAIGAEIEVGQHPAALTLVQ